MNMDANNAVENREKERDRRGRGARGSRFSDADGNGNAGGGGNIGGGGGGGGGNMVRDRSRERRNCRVYISNIPYDYRWQDLKDLFRRIVGSIEYVQLFHDESGKARGCGIVEFKDPENVQKAMEKMNRYEVNGRELVVKEDHGEQRDQYGRIVRDGAGGGGGNVGGGGGGGNNGGGGGGGGSGRDHMDDRDRGGFSRRDDDRLSGRNNFNMMSNDYNNSSNYNLYGLSASFLESLGISGPLHNKVFVANLDYKVDNKKLKQVFKLAGKVQSVDLSLDKEGNSRGFAVIEYDHPVEAVQAISMLDRQMLFDRRMTVRLDRIPDKGEGVKLPEGLGGVGIGLGPNGEPLKDVAHNLPNGGNQGQGQLLGNVQQGGQLGSVAAGQGGGGVSNASNLLGSLTGVMFGNNASSIQPSPVAPVQKPNLGNNSGAGGLNLNNLNPSLLAAVVGNLGNQGGSLSNPLLTSSLNNLGLSLGNSGGNDDPISSGNVGLSNNYSSGGTGGGNNYSSGGNNPYSGGGVSGGNVGYNAYSSSGGVGGGNGGGGLGNQQDGNDYNSGNNLDIFGGGSNVGNANSGAGNAGAGSRKSDTIIIKNVPMSCTWQTLRDKFREIGDVKFAEIRGNDVGVVRFFKERDAELAIALMDGSRLDGRNIKVTYF
ncbi:heterogeneous nuclear ribonucleoprotein M [Drosophila persimilis]|uniref:Heterogeneous nuclear ribonucleoprotein M isoform X1 n=1 Tax=Drosophila pseudoobscura pseudoobscura TaxID=46245 RepID=A0A6I8UQR0_DROPS|nr:heterogeneous nuclear ribonucleoprotein M isoform X1 [Drosophila pseudoobscura]XP_026842799.1 heterogeneous nuclear ribonucleoprotein M [Drosophila persimilis]